MKKILLTLSALFFAVSCTAINDALNPILAGDTGKISVEAVFEDSQVAKAPGSLIDSAIVTITASGYNQTFPMAINNGTETLTVEDLSPKTYTVSVKLYQSSVEKYNGSTSVTVTAGETAAAVITLVATVINGGIGVEIDLPAAPVTAAPILWNKFEGVYSLSNDANMSFVVTPSFSDVKYGNGIYIGPRNFQDAGIVFPLTLNFQNFTFEMWVKPSVASSTVDSGCYLFEIYGLGNRFVQLSANYGNKPNFRTSTTNGLSDTAANLSWYTNELFHLAVTAKEGDFLIYKNGIITDTITRTGLAEIFGNSTRVTLGNNNADTTGEITSATSSIGFKPLAGYIDNLKIYNYAKTNFADRFTE